MKNSILRRRITRYAGSACAVFLVGLGLTGCSDDLLTGTPSWLHDNIYAELEQRGNFKETLKLINAQDEDYASILQRTGSKTVFAADDDAWKRFYENNSWGITSIETMTEAQKKLLFKSNVINSAYLVDLLGNIPADEPIEGACLRRESSVNIMDSVPLVPVSKYPEVNPVRMDKDGNQIDYWKRIRGKENALVLQDDEVASMIHFMPKFMQVNAISDDDVAFLTNGEITTNKGAFVNGKTIVEPDVVCQNGYIHVLEDVATPMDNLANVLAVNPQFSIYSRLLDRFSYPSYSETLSREYQRQYGGEDSVYVKRYFNNHKSHTFSTTDLNDGGLTVTTQLPYDPGWNRYATQSANTSSYQRDAAVMLVPTDEAMMAYLENDGSDLNERYAKAGPGATAWDNAPDEVVLPLLKNTMLTSLKAAIPSLFENINNSAGETMGVKKADIDQVLWACNGLIYQTNKVYVAPEYVSVYYPCVIRSTDDLRCAYTVVANDEKVAGGEGFYAYLNNMGSKYSFIIPTDNALQYYYDPVSRYRTASGGSSTAVAYQFYVNNDGYIAATAPLVDWTNLDDRGRGEITDVIHTHTPATSTSSSGDVFNHFKDILNSSLAVGTFVPGQRFYQAKNGGPLVVEWSGNQVTGVAGSFQYERGYFIPVTEIFDKSTEGNGVSYIVDEEPVMSTFTSPYAALNDSTREDNFGEFARLFNGLDNIGADDGYSHATMNQSLKSLDNYHYTIYVPTNESVKELIEAHRLPTWDDIDDVENCIKGAESLSEEDEEYLKEQMQAMKDVISNFVLYHIQDNSLYIDGENISNKMYETACLDTATTRFVKLSVTYERGGEMTVRDNCGNVRTVDSGLNNILTRQYYFDGNTLVGDACNQIYSSSFAVIHQIDAPLFPSTASLYSPAEYEKVAAILEANPINSGSTETPIQRKRR